MKIAVCYNQSKEVEIVDLNSQADIDAIIAKMKDGSSVLVDYEHMGLASEAEVVAALQAAMRAIRPDRPKLDPAELLKASVSKMAPPRESTIVGLMRKNREYNQRTVRTVRRMQRDNIRRNQGYR